MVGARFGRFRRPAPVRWPAAIPRDARAVLHPDLVVGENRLCVGAFVNETDTHVLAVKDGRVLWRLPDSTALPVPFGDRVLLAESGEQQDQLRLVEGETGAVSPA